jgi:phytoene dehydrogenase-like protein
MTECVDAVVIGGGLGGLSAGAVLAGQGRRTVILEQGPAPGGFAASFQRGPCRFEGSLHARNGLAPGGGADVLYQSLGIAERLRLHRADPLYVLRGGGHES